MEKRSLKETLIAAVQPVAEQMGLELWGLEYFPQGKKKIVRIYIDSPDGIHVDQCAELSRHLSLLFDVEDLVPGSYTLEVSSPGLDRLFFQPDQMTPYVGQNITLQLKEPVENRKKWKGLLTSVLGDTIEIEIDKTKQQFTWDQIAKVRLQY